MSSSKQLGNKACVASFVENPLGTYYSILDENDPEGLYVLITNQGFFHGNACAPDDAKRFPVVRFPERLSNAALTRLLHRLYTDYHGVFVCAKEGKDFRDELLTAWRSDLTFVGGSLPIGKPNSQKWGIQRSSGLTYASFARKVRADVQLRRCWDLLSVACGRASAFPGGNYEAPCITSFDGLLFTTQQHAYQGLGRHQDIYKDEEPGQMQALACVHPPPPGVRRLGLAISYYPVNVDSWRLFAIALLTRWSTSPDLDLRQSPCLSLGSSGAGPESRRVHGGPTWDKNHVCALDDDALANEIEQLPNELKTLVPSRPRDGMPDAATYLQALGYETFDLAMLKRKRTASGADNLRSLFLSAAASGLAPGSALAQSRFPTSITASFPCLIQRCIRYGAPEKLDSWLMEGGRYRHADTAIQQPSGSAHKRYKKQGTILAFGRR